MNTDRETLNSFGQFLIENLRDRALTFYDNLLSHSNLHPTLQIRLRTELGPWKIEQQEIVRQCIGLAIDSALHDFLLKLQEVADNHDLDSNEHRIQIVIDGTDITELSDDLHWGPYGDDGWITKYSKFDDFNVKL